MQHSALKAGAADRTDSLVDNCLATLLKGLTMDTTDLATCSELLGEIAAGFASMPIHTDNAEQAALACILVQGILGDLARHLVAGMAPSEALEAFASGQLEPPDPAGTVFGIISGHHHD